MLDFDLAAYDLSIRGVSILWQGQILIQLTPTDDGFAYRNQAGEVSTFATAEDAARFVAIDLRIVPPGASTD